MAYIRHDENNIQVNPQPSSITVNQFSGTEGWSTVTYQDWNADFVRHDESNNVEAVGSYQRHDENNSPVSPGTYQRHDESNNPILA